MTIDSTPTEKRCSSCGETKPLSEFYRGGRRYRDGHRDQCKQCTNAATRRRSVQRRSGHKPARLNADVWVEAYKTAERRLHDAHALELAALYDAELRARGVRR